jgi:hypothetical protein
LRLAQTFAASIRIRVLNQLGSLLVKARIALEVSCALTPIKTGE